MKKSLLFLGLILLIAPSLGSCRFSKGPEKIELSYGSLIDTNYTDIDYAKLEAKTIEEENFVLVTYPGKDSTCSCWRIFELVIEDFVLENDAIIYAIDVFQVIGKNNDFNLSLSTSSPSIAFFEKGELKEQIAYSTKSPQAFYKNYSDFRDLILEKTTHPEILYVDSEIIDNAISNKDDFVIMHTYSSCPDCSYCLPNVVVPFAQENDLSANIWIIDLNEIREDETKWQSYKDKYNLSNKTNEALGYNNGYVPTAQAYENGELVSASVYFNDTIELINNQYVITDSFYTNERVENLTYLDGLENVVLKGLVVSEDDVDVYLNGQYIAWKQEKANEYHKPLLNAFLNKYTK